MGEKKNTFLEGHENKWVALNNDESRVVASADTLKAAYDNARKSGEDRPVVFKVPSKSGGYIL